MLKTNLILLPKRIKDGLKFYGSFQTAIQLEEKVLTDLNNVVYKPRKHPGVMKHKNVQLPKDIIKAIDASTEEYPPKKLVSDGEALTRYLAGRHPPVNQMEWKEKYDEVKLKLLESKKYHFEGMPDDERLKHEKYLHNEILNKCKKQLYGWKPLSYDELGALTYLFGRSAQEYAVLVRVFGEIDNRMPNFKPRSFLDFGSGVGTGTWAAMHFWKENLFEYFCVDSSSAMNDLADILLRGGRANKINPLKGISYRQFLPASLETRYDIVLCAYTLFEMLSAEMRLEKLLKLWNKTEQFLVIVEMGTNAGFSLISEARDFLLRYDAEIFAPCPHSQACPRFMTGNTPCNFEVKYSTLPLAAISQVRSELFSYIVLKKKINVDGSVKESSKLSRRRINRKFKEFLIEKEEIKRSRSANEGKENLINEKITTSDESDCEGNSSDHDEDVVDAESVTCKWPRIVRPTLVRSKHTVCRMCTDEGKLKEVVVTASKHGKTVYHCVRSSNWGDLLPVSLSDVKKKVRIGNKEPDG